MIDINDYILLSKAERQVHLDLNSPCEERGGYSTMFKGLLARTLGTTIPRGMGGAMLCHACHNSACSNPFHLYWGTVKENRQDAIANGAALNPYYSLVRRYGVEEANRRMAQVPRSPNFTTKGRKASEKIELSQDHKNKISNSVKRHWELRRQRQYSTKLD